MGLEAPTTRNGRAAFARFEPLPDNQPQPLAMRYHGHQFQTYNPDLGDGRGFLFAQLREAGTGRLLDLATKGSGRTPWSRAGDGRLTLKGGVREVLAAELLEGLGVPTSRAFSLIETGEALERGDEPSPTRSAVLTRLSWSHIRFGSFQRHAFLERPDLVRTLADHVLETYYPDVAGEARTAGLLRAVVAAVGDPGRSLDGRGVRARCAQHRQHEHHRRELRLRALPVPALQRPQLHRRLFRRERPLRLRPPA